MKKKENIVFLLGGHDLEMETIKDVLSQGGYSFIDKGLTWQTAKLSQYKEEIVNAAAEGKTIYGIELVKDIPTPNGYNSIDHHNDRSDSPSSLEQVASLLKLPLTRWQLLVAINDKAYIPGLATAGATVDEIDTIRTADRKAQGVTAEDEQQAINDIANGMSTIGDLVVVKTTCRHFSAICDRLYPYKRLLVYNDHEWTFYGEGAERVYHSIGFLSAYEGVRKHIYRGGGSHGYVGLTAGCYSAMEVKEMTERIINLVNNV